MKSPIFLGLLGASLLLSGCISHVAVRRVEPDPKPSPWAELVAKITKKEAKLPKPPRGLRYYLPQRILVGTPQPSGKIVYTIEYLPDPDHQYAIDSWSFMANHTAKISRSEQLFLTKVDLSQDTTAVAKKLLEGAGTVGTEVVTKMGEQRVAAEQAAAKAATDAVTAKATAATAKAAAVKEQDAANLKRDKADAAVVRADAKVKALEGAPQRDEAAIAKAKEALETAQGVAADAALDAKAAKVSAGAFDAPSVVPTRTIAQGPVMYLIKENGDGHISLEPLDFDLTTQPGEKIPGKGTQIAFRSQQMPDKKKEKAAIVEIPMASEATIPLDKDTTVIKDSWSVGADGGKITSDFTFDTSTPAALVVRLKPPDSGTDRRVKKGKYTLEFKVMSNDESETVTRILNIL